MFKSQILQIFLDIDKERDGLYLNTKKYAKDYDKVIECEDALIEKFRDNEEIMDLFRKHDMALGTYHYLELQEMFRKAFIFGAQVAMEMLGVEADEEVGDI